jgi:glycosyltransferase involved in cell wall biosynthesis
MQIAFISASKVPSRTANSIEVMKVCQAFQELGHTIHLWVPGNNPRVVWSELAELYGLQESFKITWIPSWSVLRRYDFSLQAVLASSRWGADLLYIWPLQAAALAAKLGLKTLLEVHDAPQGRFGPWLFKQFLKGSGARRILPITDAIRYWLVEAYQTPLDPPFSVIAPSGVDLARFAGLPKPEIARKELQWPDKVTVGYTGHLYPGRGMNLMLDLARTHSELHFVWAGGEPETVKEWRDKIAIEGPGNLTLLGFVPNERLPIIQAACDILLLPHERHVSASSGGDIARFTSPMKLFEYLATGRAILSSDLPVLREVLDEQVAVLVPPEDFLAWSRSLQELSVDHSRRKILGDAARALAQQYSWKARAERTLVGIEND